MSCKVLYVNTPTYTGGAEISLLTLMRHLNPERYAPLLVTSGEGKLVDAARAYGIKVFIQEFPWFRKRYPWRYAASIVRLIQIIRMHQIDLVHTNCDHSLRYVMCACQWRQSPYVAHVRDFVRAWFEPVNLQALDRAAIVLANSRAIATACVDAGVEPTRVRTVYNPIDISLFKQTAETDRVMLRSQLGLPESSFLVGIVGQIQPIKGHAEFVDAAAGVASSLPEVDFIVVGDTLTPDSLAFKEQLAKRINDRGLSNRFHFLGFCDDIPEIMRLLDVLVVPSWSEPFGRVVVEGQASGCPVIGTAVGGIPEIIEDGINGLLIPPRNAVSMAAAIISLAVDTALRQRLREGGLATSQRFDVQHHVDQIQTLYDEILGIGVGSASP